MHEPQARTRPHQVTGGQDAGEADPMRMDREAELVDEEDGATDADYGADRHDEPDIADGRCLRRTRLAGEHGGSVPCTTAGQERTNLRGSGTLGADRLSAVRDGQPGPALEA